MLEDAANGSPKLKSGSLSPRLARHFISKNAAALPTTELI